MLKLLSGLVALFGLGVMALGGWMLVRGPFLGGQVLEPMPMFAALLAFVVGLVVFFRGAVRWAGIGSRI